MPTINEDIFQEEDSLAQNQQLHLLLFRILPYWPWIVLAILFGFMGARVYLRYATSVYAVKARVIVNDDSQQKTANLVDIVQLDTRNMSTETEKEMEIMRSRNLLAQLARNLQLNVQYGSKGYINSGQSFDDGPFKLILEHPDSISSSFSGSVVVMNEKIKFNDIMYPCDTFVQSTYGKIKWHINRAYVNKTKDEDWYVNVETIHKTVNQLKDALTIEPISKQSSILDLAYNDALPHRGLIILSSLLELYGTSTIDYKSRISENTLRFLDERLRLISGELSGVEKNLQNYKTRNDIVDLSAQATVILDQLKETDSKISGLDVKLDVLDKIKDYVTHRNSSDSEIPATLGIDDPVLIDLLNQLYKAEFELQKVKQTSGSKNPRIEVLQETIDKLRPSILSSLNNLRTGLQTSLQRLRSDNNKFNSVLNKMPVKERELLDISRQQ